MTHQGRKPIVAANALLESAIRVNFDSQIFSAQTFGGISRYFASLAREMNGIPDVQARIVAPLHSNGYLQALPEGIVHGRSAATSSLPKNVLRAGSLFFGSLLQASMPSDILHKTYYYPLTELPGRRKTVLTVYDMIHEKFPQYFSPRDPIARWKKRAAQRVDQIICISEHTRTDLITFNPEIDVEKIAVTPLGFDSLDGLLPDERGSTFRERVLGVDAPYLLFVGNRSGYKNFTALLAAFQASDWLKAHFHLLCFGGGAFTAVEQKLIAARPGADRVVQIAGDDSALASCYRHTSLFVYPSLYEGFGIPPLEAMSLDCPVACSNTSSIPEVVGDAAAFFDPHDMDNMRTVLENTLNSSATVADLVTRGRVRKTHFSWRKCAEQTIDIYRETLAR